MRLALLLLVAGSALAHDLYIMPSSFRPQPGQALTLGFHVGDSFPNSEVAGQCARRPSAASPEHSPANLRTTTGRESGR